MSTSIRPRIILTNEQFRELVGQRIGRASICWSEPPHGVFDAGTARALVDEIVADHEASLAEAEVKCCELGCTAKDILEGDEFNRIRSALNIAIKAMENHGCCSLCKPCGGCKIHDAFVQIKNVFGAANVPV